MMQRSMSHTARVKASLISAAAAVCASHIATSAHAQVQQPATSGDRLLGLDISAWQGNISQQTWNNFYNIENRDFVFLRSSRGGTTGYYNQSDSDNSEGLNTLSQRYDDPYFIQNITRATNAGMLAGAYHFGRMDIIETTQNSGGVRNNGTDEANHFLQMAGAWMRPGYLLPTFDLEAGIAENTATELAQFAIDFSNRIYEVKGVRPIVYIGGNYAADIQTSPLAGQVVAAYPHLWTARWPNQADPNSIPVQTADPGDYTSTVYGHWDNVQGADPWKVWQYASTGRLPSFNNGGSNLDFDVVHGNIEYLKDMQTPALWTGGTTGNWNTLSNWNSGQDSTQPVAGPGQVTPVGVNWATMKPEMRLPEQEDNVDLNVPTQNVTITLNSGTHNIRRLNLNERLNVTGGSLSARLSGQVGAGGTLSLAGGQVTFNEGFINNGGVLDFSGSGTLTVGTLFLAGNPTFTGTTGMGLIDAKAGAPSPVVNLQAGTRTFDVGDGDFITDMRIALPLTNGNLIKSGDGTLELTGNNSTFNGNLTVSRGYLQLTNSNQLGITGVTTTQTNDTGTENDFGGTVRIMGSGLNFNRPITIGGSGRAFANSNFGALENTGGDNTWSGAVRLAGTESSLGAQGLNQIYAFGGTALNITGVISNNSGSAATWAKTGAGDVVLGGAGANTYTGLTRLFGGRLIIEKNGALGSAGSDTAAAANTFQLGGVESTLAFRGGVNYTTNEWLFTDGLGSGSGAYGQIDSLGGANTFAGHIGLGGPTVNGAVESYLGVNSGSLELSGKIYAKSSTGAQARNIVKRGVGTLILSGDSSGTPTNNGQSGGQAGALANSSFVVGAGTVQLKGTAGNTANLPGVTSWKINNGATLDVAKTGAAGNANVLLNGGKLTTNVSALSLAGTLRTDSAGTGGNVETVGASAVLTLGGQLDNSAGKTVRKQGAGAWNINGAQSHGTGAAFINEAGTTRFNTDAGSLASMNLAITVNASTIVNFNTTQHLNTLAVNNSGLATLAAGNDKIVRSRSLALTGNAQLDLNDNDLIVDYVAGGTSPYVTIKDYSINGYRFGYGLTSTTGDAAGNTILAVVDNAQFGKGSWAGESVDSSTVIGKYTYFGDANMDGKVTGIDYFAIDANIGRINAQWFHGDFNLDGKVTGIDYFAIDANIGSGANDPLLVDLQQQMIAQHTAMYGDEYADLLNAALDGNFTVVPEPSSLSLLAFTGLLLRRRRS